MFGSLSNWVNTNIPTNMPTLPTVNIPSFLGKNKSNTDETIVSKTDVVLDEKSNFDGDAPVANENATIVETKSGRDSQNSNERPQSSEQESELANADAAVHQSEEKEAEETTSSANAGKNAAKALESAKELGNNIGSKSITRKNFLLFSQIFKLNFILFIKTRYAFLIW
jgi:hypothetical protein